MANLLDLHPLKRVAWKSPTGEPTVVRTLQNDTDEEWPSGGFPGGAVVKNLPANAGDTGSSPGLGRSHMPQSS